MKILTVDDNDIQLQMLTQLLRNAGYEVISASTGSEALKKSVAESPDAMLLDINLPDINGFNVCAAMKADMRTAAIPVIFYTAQSGGAVKDHAEMVGGSAFLTYPIEVGQLRLVIDSVIQKSSGLKTRDPSTK